MFLNCPFFNLSGHPGYVPWDSEHLIIKMLTLNLAHFLGLGFLQTLKNHFFSDEYLMMMMMT